MSWAKLLASNRVTQQPSAKAELGSLRSIVARCFSDVTAKGLSADARFIMAYDAARTLSVMIVRAAGYRPIAAATNAISPNTTAPAALPTLKPRNC